MGAPAAVLPLLQLPCLELLLVVLQGNVRFVCLVVVGVAAIVCMFLADALPLLLL